MHNRHVVTLERYTGSRTSGALTYPKTVDLPPRRPARVVYRSNNNANSNCGVAYANANNDAANTNTWNGSRLALMQLKR